MEIKGLVWHGSQTDHFDEMVAFVRDVLGMKTDQIQEENIVFAAPNGDAFEIFPKRKGGPVFYEHPGIGFLVDDVASARAEMEAKGVEFTGPIQYGTPGKNWGSAWCSFRAPDGFLYALVSRPQTYPGGSKRKFQELRICFAVDDLEKVKRLYRDGLGLPVVDEWTHPSGEKGLLLAVCPTSLEFFDRSQAALVDRAEVGHQVSGPVTLRAEFEDINKAANELKKFGFTQVSDARRTPWNQNCLRMEAPEPSKIQLTLFELAPEEEEARRKARALLPN